MLSGEIFKKAKLCVARLQTEECAGLKVLRDNRMVNFSACRNACLLTVFYGEFDSGSERTLAACLRHASRTEDL
jgi:hypothetical protein